MDKMFMILLLAALFIGFYWLQNNFKFDEPEHHNSKKRTIKRTKHTDTSEASDSDISISSISSMASKETYGSLSIGSMNSQLSLNSSIDGSSIVSSESEEDSILT